MFRRRSSNNNLDLCTYRKYCPLQYVPDRLCLCLECYSSTQGKTERRRREVGVEKRTMEGGIGCSSSRLPTSNNPPYVPKPQSTVHRPATMKQFSLSRIPHKVPFAIANGLTTYYSWVTIHPVLPRVPQYICWYELHWASCPHRMILPLPRVPPSCFHNALW